MSDAQTAGLVELSLNAPREQAERIAATLESADRPPTLSVSLFELRNANWRISAHYADDARNDIAALVKSSGWTGPFDIAPVPDTDWVARSQAYLAPVRAGRFLVHGSHDRKRAQGRHAIEIDANRAFGTAHHETTRGCLLMLDRVLKSYRPQRILDLGCGSGVLAIAAARALKRPVIASDSDPVAVAIARANAKKNGERRHVRIIKAEGFAHADLRNGPTFDLILANILLGPLLRLAPAIASRTAHNGLLILSGITSDQLGTLRSRYIGVGIRPVAQLIPGDWAILLMRRARAR